MARPKSEDKRNALLLAATRVIVNEGLGAPTATIAQEARVSTGSLFTYFKTKSELLNELYLDIKSGMAAAVFEGMPESAATREQFFHVWCNWMRWAMSNPDKRRALAILTVSDDITQTTRNEGSQAMLPIAKIMELARAKGPMRDTPMPFVSSVMNSLAEATMDYMSQNPENADVHCKTGFDALWRMLN